MKTAVVTLCIGDEYFEMAKISHNNLKAYADKINSDFVVLKSDDTINPHWQKFQIYNLLKDYERIIFLDTDILVRDDCPNLFDIVPSEKIGIFNEGQYLDRMQSIRYVVKMYKRPLDKWDGTYYNTGVFVVSRYHRDLFILPDVIHPLGFHEQDYLNLQILSGRYEVFDLDYQYNRMHFIDQLTGEPRYCSYIMHYAGAPSNQERIEIMKQDIDVWNNAKPDYKFQRNIIVVVSGGLGDQIESEPIVRHLSELYKDDNFEVHSYWPELFDHLPVINKRWSSTFKPKVPFLKLETLPDGKSNVWLNASSTLCHHVDFTSLACGCNILPDDKKNIEIKMPDNIVDEAIDIKGDSDFSNMILVHPGKGWQSKTFPSSWWESIINQILEQGYQVGVIGKRVSEDQGYVNINLPDNSNCFDFRDLLTVKGLFGIIKMAPILVTNDSAPVHIAGAFDNHIILIPSCKHPDFVLPYRHGVKNYKASSLYKRLTCDNIDITPGRLKKQTIDRVDGDILDYLPEPYQVITEINNMLQERV